MEILKQEDYQTLLAYLPGLKLALDEWQLADIRLAPASEVHITIEKVAELVQGAFHDKEGKIFQCNTREVFMLIQGGKEQSTESLVKSIEAVLPAGSCEVVAQEPTPEGLDKIEILITYRSSDKESFAAIRATRRENVVLVIDDDHYMRTLVAMGLKNQATVHEADNGNDVINKYKSSKPDVLLLDIHLPGKSGSDVLHEILTIDPDAYVIMLTSDSSPTNVARTTRGGAKGFMAKPFTKKALLEHVQKAPTFI